MSRHKKILIAAFLFCFLIIGMRILTVPLKDAGKARDAIHGDAYSDINTYSALRYFYDFGFSKSYYLPVHGYEENGDTSHIGAYTHYPALPDILAGVYAKILHTTDTSWIRIFPVFISIGFFFFIFHFFKTLLSDTNAAFISALCVVLSNYFIFWADNLHKHLYEELFKWLYIYFLFLYYTSDKRKILYLSICGLLFILATNVSFEPVTYLAFATVGITWVYKRKIFCYENFFLGAMPIIGFGIHFYQNVLYFGSLKMAYADMTHAATLRTVGNASVQNEMKRNLGLLDYLDIPFMWLRRIERYFIITGPAFTYLAYLGLAELRRKEEKLFGIGISLLAATLSWNLVMSQHSIVHGFTTRHIGIFFGFAIGYGILAYYKKLQEDWSGTILYKKILHVGFIGYVLAMFVSQQLWDYLRYGLLYPWLN